MFYWGFLQEIAKLDRMLTRIQSEGDRVRQMGTQLKMFVEQNARLRAQLTDLYSEGGLKLKSIIRLHNTPTFSRIMRCPP